MILALLQYEPPSGLLESDWRWIFLAAMVLGGLMLLVGRLWTPKRWPYPEDDSSTPGEEDEALGCFLADPNRGDFTPRTRMLAGRAALRRELRRTQVGKVLEYRRAGVQQ